MDKKETQNYIAKRVAQELEDGILVNLGIGLPTKVANYVPEGVNVIFHSENGFVGLGKSQTEEPYDYSIINAGGAPVTIIPGGAAFDSATSFGIIRGGHVDLTILGALQVDEKGNIANYMIPGKMVPGMGGGMDLLTGAKKNIVAMEHTNKGKHKIMKECNLPLTALEAVDQIITEMCVIEVSPEGLVLKEINPEYTIEEVQDATEAELMIHDNLKEVSI